jgi:photosystem II stability/assembly factor-like uncharacterized protein
LRSSAFILFVLFIGLALPTVGGQESIRQVQTGSWAPFGPASLQPCGTGSPVDLCSGRVTSIALDPNHPGTIFVGAAQGGVWKSTDNGSRWVPLTDGVVDASLAVGSIAIAPNGDIYVGTGEGNNSGDSYYGAGVLKSTDGGKTWVRLGASTFGKSAFTKLIISPRGDIILAATNTGHTSSSTVGKRVDPGVPLGVYVSTDGGNTWSLTLVAKNQTSDVIFDPVDSAVEYAAVDGGVYVSKNSGLTWTGPLAGGLPFPKDNGRINLGVSASSHLTVFAAIEDISRTPSRGALYQSINGGASWSSVNLPRTPRSQGGFCGDQCDYDMYVAVDPTDTNTVYLGGLDLYRTTDGAASWIDLGGYAGFIHPDQHAFAFDPASHSAIYVGNDGGVWSSRQGNTCSPDSCWTNLNSGLSTVQFQSVATHPTDKNTLLGGTQDNGALLHQGASSVWTQVESGDGGWVAFDPKNPLTMFDALPWTGGGVERSDDGGSKWISITDPTNGVNTKDKALFYVPLAMDPTSSKTLYLGTYRLYKTTSKGNVWFFPNPGLSFSSTGACSISKREDCISAISVAPSNGQDVYVGTNTGKFFVSNDGGNSFAERSQGLPGRPLTKIAIDANVPTKVFVTYSDFGTGHVFLTTDSGVSWTDISSNLPDVPTQTILLGAGGKTIYVGTDKGVYFSTDNGQVWSFLGGGLPRVVVVDLALTVDGKLVAATHGRGVWVYTTKILVTFVNEPADATLTIDGTSYSGQQLGSIIFEWDKGSTHTLQVSASIPSSPGVRYGFLGWADGSKDLSRMLTATEHGDYSALFRTQYELTVISDFGYPQGDGWYDAGSTATFAVTSPVPEPGLLGLLGGSVTFRGWTGSISSASATATIVMDEPKTVQASWVTDNSRPYAILIAVLAAVTVTVILLVRRRRSSVSMSSSSLTESSPFEA